jgi:hypothetical protein
VVRYAAVSDARFYDGMLDDTQWASRINAYIKFDSRDALVYTGDDFLRDPATRDQPQH